MAAAGGTAGSALAAGRIYPLACLVAVALCAFTAAGNDRLTAVGQWIRRASQADLARLRAPQYPMAGRYRAPDEKTIRIVQDPPRHPPRRPPALGRAAAGCVTRSAEHGRAETRTIKATHVSGLDFPHAGSGPVNLATIRAAVTAALEDAGYLHIPEGRRDHTTPAETLRLHGLD